MSGEKEVKASIGYTVGNVLIRGISFITLPIFSRLLSTAEYGIYNTYYAYESIIAILLGMGMYASIKNANLDFKGKVNEYVSTILILTLIPLTGFILAVVLFPNYASSLLGLDINVILLMIFQAYGTAMLNISNAKLALNYQYKKYLAYAGFNTVLNVVLSIVLIFTVFNNHREYGRIIGSAVPLILIAIYVFFTNIHKAKLFFDKSMAKYAAGIGFPLIWHYLSQQIQSQFDRIAISKLVDNASTGIYSFAYTIASVLQVIFYSVENVWSVWMFSQMEAKNYKKIREVSKKYMLLIAVIAIAMLVVSKELIFLVGSEKYRISEEVFIPILIGIFLLYLYTIPVSIEYYYKKTKYIALMTAISAVVNIVLNFLMIPIWGYAAAAYTTMISYAVQFIGHWIISKKILKNYGIKNVYYLKDIVAIFLLVCFSGVLVSFLNKYPFVKYMVFTIIAILIICKTKEDLYSLIFILKKRNKK